MNEKSAWVNPNSGWGVIQELSVTGAPMSLGNPVRVCRGQSRTLPALIMITMRQLVASCVGSLSEAVLVLWGC